MATISTNNAKQNLDNSAKKAGQAVNEASRTLREVAEDAGSKVRDFIGEKQDQAEEFRHTAESKIVDNPLKSVAFAALGGLIIGALLRR